MKTYPRRFTATWFEQLEQRRHLSVHSLLTQEPQTAAVQLETMASLVSSALSNAPPGDPIYMKYEGIDGSVTALGFVGEIQLESFQWGVDRNISSATGGAGRESSAPSVSEIVVTKKSDSSSVPLLEEAFGGSSKDVKIDFVDANGELYLKLELENTLISGFAMNSGGDLPIESLSLNFTKISFFSVRHDTGKTQSFVYDLAQNQTEVVALPLPAVTPTETKQQAIFMKYGDIAGDVTVNGYKEDIGVSSFSWGMHRDIGTPPGSVGREASAPSVSEIVVTKRTDHSSVPLIGEALAGTPSAVKIDFFKTQTPYLKVELSDVLISGYSLSTGGEQPTESLSLNFTKISFSSLDIKGSPQTFEYDVHGEKPILTAGDLTQQALRAGPQKISPIFMKYGEITGDVTVKDYKEDIALNSFSWGVSRPFTSAAREAAAPSISEIVVTKKTDSSSVPLIGEAFGGTPSAVKIDFVNKITPYLKLELENVLVSGFSMDSGGAEPTESLSLNFTKISFSALDRSGEPRKVSWDLAQAKGAITAAPEAVSPDGSPPHAGDPIYMKYGDIKGEVNVQDHKETIEINSFSWGVSRGISAGGAGREASTPSVSEVVVTKRADSSSVPLVGEALNGTQSLVKIDFVNKATAYLAIQMENTLVSGYSISSGGDRPTESLSLNYTKISFNSLDRKGDSKEFKYDLTDSQSVAQPLERTRSAVHEKFRPSPMFMKYGDITGDVTVKAYKEDIAINSFSWGVTRAVGLGGNGGREASTPSVSEIVVTKKMDSSSIPLVGEAFGSTPKTVKLDFVNKTTPYLKLELTNTMVSGFAIGASGGDLPTESLSLNFTKISFSALDRSGQTQKVTWDLAQAKGALTAAPEAIVPTGSPPRAGDPIYMNYGDIPGDVSVKGYENTIEVDSFHWGVSRTFSNSQGAGREASAPSVSEIVITKINDSSSVPLIRDAFGNTPANDVSMDFVNKTLPYFKVKLTDVLVSGYSADSDGEQPMESLSLNFTKISLSFVRKEKVQLFAYDLATGLSE